MYLIDTRKYDDVFLLAKILEKVDFADEETKKLFKHFEKPTVDAEPVVRCKNCKYYEETGSGGIGTCLLTISGAEDDGFCAWAERKEDD